MSNKKKFKATEDVPMEPIGSREHKKFIEGLVNNPVPPYNEPVSERENIYDELAEQLWDGVQGMRYPKWEEEQRNKATPLFDELADASLERVRNTYTHAHEEGRGAQYGDTMRMCQFLTVAAVEEKLAADHPQRRLALFLAGMVDMKLERMRGGYRDDNLVDLIAYGAALAELMKRIERDK